MSTQVIAVIITLLANLLPMVGVNVGSEDLTKTAQVLITVISGLWIWYQRTTLQHAPMGQGDVNKLGFRKD